MYLSEKFFNLVNCYQDDNLNLYKDKDSKDGWNAKAQSIHKIIQYEPGLGFQIDLSPTTQNYEFAIGFSNKSIDNLRVYTYLDYSIYVKTGSFGRIRLFKNEYPLLTISNLAKSIKIESSNLRDVWNFIVDNKILYTFSYQPKYPIYLYVFLYNTKDYPLNIKFNPDNKQYILPKSIDPPLNQKINLFQIFTIDFDVLLNQYTVNNENIILKDLNTNENQEIDIKHIILKDKNDPNKKYSQIQITNKNEFQYNHSYQIQLTENILSNNNIPVYPTQYTYTTISETDTSIVDEEYYPSSDVNDIYYKAKILYDILNIDEIVINGEKYNFEYFPTEFNPISKNYEIKSNAIIKHDNKELFLELYQHQLLYEFTNYFKGIKEYNIDTDYFNKIRSLLFKNAKNINYYKGNREQIKFVHQIFAELTNRHMVWVDPDPFYTFKYRISTDLTWLDHVKYNQIMTHPEGWALQFIHVDKQIPRYLDNLEKEWRKEIEFDIKNVHITYLDVNYYITKINDYYEYIDFYGKYIANAKWQDLQLPVRFDFNPNKYNSPTKYQVENMYKEIRYPTHLSIKQIKLYQDDNAQFEINYLKTGLSIDYIHNFEFRGVNQFNKKNPHYKTIVNLGKNYNYRVWYNFYFKDFHYKIDYYLIPFVNQRFRLDNLPYAQHTFGIENTLNIAEKRDQQIKNFNTNFQSKKTYLINHYNLNYTHIDKNDIIINKKENDEDEIVEVNDNGLFLEFEYIINNVNLISSLNKIKINKNIMDNLKIIGRRQNYSFQII